MHEAPEDAVLLIGLMTLFGHEVGLRDYADHALLVVDDRHPGDAVGGHFAGCVLQRHLGSGR